MNRDGSESKYLINRTYIARAVFAAAESMGMADRNQVERIIGQVIERLEKSRAAGGEQPLPGMKTWCPGLSTDRDACPVGRKSRLWWRRFWQVKSEKRLSKRRLSPR